MKLYFRYLSIHIKSAMQYKASFAMTMIGQFLFAFTLFLTVSFMMDRFNSVLGFSYEQVLLCFAVTLMSFTLSELYGRGFDLFPNTISNGEFDRILVRPRGIIFQVLSSKLDLTRTGRIIQAALMLCIAIPGSGITWTADKICTLVLMIGCGSLVFFALFVIYAGICFFTIEGLEAMNILTYGVREFGRYPFSIYGNVVLKFLTFVVPVALFQYYPLLYLIGQTDSLLYMLSPVLGLWFLVPAFLFWRFGVSRYRSTGS